MESENKNNSNNLDASKSELKIFEGLSVRLQPAPLSLRILAYCTDLAIISAILYLLFIVYTIVSVAIVAVTANMNKDVAAVFAVVLIAIAVIIALMFYHGYFILMEYKAGRTLGKKVFGLNIISLTGQKLSLGQCVMRDMFRYIDAMMVLPGLISIIVTDKKQRLGDLTAHTLVTHSKRKQNRQESTYLSLERFQFLDDMLSPQNIDKNEATIFLQFAFPYFILGTSNASEADINAQVTWTKSKLKSPVPNDIASDELLRYMAEYAEKLVNKTQ